MMEFKKISADDYAKSMAAMKKAEEDGLSDREILDAGNAALGIAPKRRRKPKDQPNDR